MMDGGDRSLDAGADLRSRLCEMRAELVGKLEQRIDGGMLALLGTVHGAIAAVDAVPEDVADAARAVVSDDGETIQLMFYGEDGAACGLELAPAHAVALAGPADRGGFDQAAVSEIFAALIFIS
jgi:hypothetical protein